MTVTYVRLKNRRGNKADLPKPLAEGELGFALDTRELYIGGGDQNLKNRMVQVENYLNAQTSVQSDLDNRLIYFSLSDTQSYVANGSNANSGSLSLPTGATISASTDFVVTKYNVNNYPTTQSTDTYTIGNVAVSTFDFNFTSTNIPEANSVIVVSKWTETATRTAITTALSLTDPDNELFLDVTTGTGFVDIGTSGNATATIASLTALDQISDANVNANINILGWSSDLPYSARSFSIDGERLIEVDSPKQAQDLSTFLNISQGSTTATVANNIKVYTQDSRPDFDNNFYINHTNLNRQTLTAGQTNQVVTSFAVATVNTLFVDYSFKHGSAHAIGQLRVISDGLTAEFLDDRTETDSTSSITFSTDLTGPTVVANTIDSTSKNYKILTLGTTDFTLIGSSELTAGNFVVGTEYIISSAGTTDFTLIGATDSNVGTTFIATGTGSGSGTALVSRFTSTAAGSGDGTAIELTTLQLKADNGHVSQDATISYVLKRWLTQ